ncbi:MAG: glycosyltransferase family A protein [Acetobacteraceae bacterium]
MSGTAPRFTVLLPTHNRADVLGLAIASVLAQSEPDFELLVVADGCTDATRDVVAAFPDPRLRLFDLPKAPHFGYASRNVALRQARGRLIAFAPHDDLLLPDHLALMGDLVERSGAAWAYSRPLWVSLEGLIVPVCTDLAIPDDLRMFMEVGNTIPAACVVHTRAALERAGFWPENVPSGGDWVLWRQMIRDSGGNIAHTRQPTSLHFVADWRRTRVNEIGALRVLTDLAAQSPWWPDVLRHPPAGEPEQAAVWRAMRAGGLPWVRQLRAAIDTVVDRIAWMTVCGLWSSVEAALAAQARAEADAARCRVNWRHCASPSRTRHHADHAALHHLRLIARALYAAPCCAFCSAGRCSPCWSA